MPHKVGHVTEFVLDKFKLSIDKLLPRLLEQNGLRVGHKEGFYCKRQTDLKIKRILDSVKPPLHVETFSCMKVVRSAAAKQLSAGVAPCNMVGFVNFF